MDEPTLSAAVEQLYSGDPADFVATRKRLVAQIRKTGDKDLAKTVGALRRPTAAAYAINRLARLQDPPAIPPLQELGARLRAAQAHMDARALKALAGERSALISQLLSESEQHGATTPAIKDQLTQSFTAALASQDAESAVCSGHLVQPLSYSGFGEVEVDEAVAVPLRELQQARVAELAAREHERAERPTRGTDDESAARASAGPPEDSSHEEGGDSETPSPITTDTEPPTTTDAELPPPPDEAGAPAAAPAIEQTPPTGFEPSPTDAGRPDVRALYDECASLEREALAAVDRAREALTWAKAHAASATRARQAAEELLDSAD